jgi:hypothetical protein
MEIRHRIGFNADAKPTLKTALDDVGIEYKITSLPGHRVGLVYFDVTESDRRWVHVRELIQRKGASDVYDTMFPSEEILDAEWIRLMPVFEQGYPQPEKGMAWKRIAYEHKCIECGAGYRQKVSLRLKKEPRLGQHDFLCLFWTYTVFCTPRVLTALKAHQIQGYEVWDAIIHQTNQLSQEVSQLVFPHVAQPGLADEDQLQLQVCQQCGITKYSYHRRGYMHLKRDSLVADTDIQLTHEWFGSGHTGFREILISNRLARLILEEKWHGVSLKPTKLV